MVGRYLNTRDGMKIRVVPDDRLSASHIESEETERSLWIVVGRSRTVHHLVDSNEMVHKSE